MKRLMVCVLALGGCSTGELPLAADDPVKAFFYGTPQAQPFPGPNGRTGYSIECAGGSRSAECFEAAVKVCDGQYEVMTRGQVGEMAVVDVLCGTSPRG